MELKSDGDDCVYVGQIPIIQNLVPFIFILFP